MLGEDDLAIGWLEEAIERIDEVSDPMRAGVLHSRLGYSLWAAERNEEAQAEHRDGGRASSRRSHRPPPAPRSCSGSAAG